LKNDRKKALAKELTETLFEKTSDDAARLKIRIMRSRHLILTGGRWKNQVMEWLKAKGF
jgi:large subunit ribosomal protein L49